MTICLAYVGMGRCFHWETLHRGLEAPQSSAEREGRPTGLKVEGRSPQRCLARRNYIFNGFILHNEMGHSSCITGKFMAAPSDFQHPRGERLLWPKAPGTWSRHTFWQKPQMFLPGPAKKVCSTNDRLQKNRGWGHVQLWHSSIISISSGFINIAMEISNIDFSWWLMMICPLELVIFHNYVKLPQGIAEIWSPWGCRSILQLPGRRLTSDAQGVDIGVLVPPYLPLFGKGPGLVFVPIRPIRVRLSVSPSLSLSIWGGLFEREMGKSDV